MNRTRRAIAVFAGIAVVLIASVIAYHLGARHAESADAPGTDPKCIDFHEVQSHVGERACVTGRVLRVFTSRSGSTFLDFCENYRDCPFTSVIFSSERSRFGNLASLQGRNIEITGEITSYRGRAEVIIHQPEQIQAVR